MVKPPCLLPLTSLSFPSLSSPLLSDHAWSLCMTVCITSWPCYSLPTPAASKWFHVHLDNRLNCYINGLNSFQHYPNVHEPLLDFSLALLRSVIWPSLGAVHTSHIDVIFRLKMQYIADSCAQLFHIHYLYAVTFVNQLQSLIKAQSSGLIDKFVFKSHKTLSVALIVFSHLVLSWLIHTSFPLLPQELNLASLQLLDSFSGAKLIPVFLLCSVSLMCPDLTFLWLSLPCCPSQRSRFSFTPVGA